MGSTTTSRDEPRGGFFQLVKRLVGGDLGSYLEERRKGGLSWRQISRELYSEAGVSVSEETLANWANRLGVAKKAS